MNVQGYYSARPTLLIDGREERGLAEGLLNAVVEEQTEGLYRAELTFGNWGARGDDVGYLYFDRALLDFGKELEVRMGSGEAAASVFLGRITALEARYPQNRAPELVVLAEDRFQDLRMTRRTRTFENVSDEELFRKVAAEHNLTAKVDMDATMTHDVIAQVNQSDLAFLRERARAIDALVWTRGEELFVTARSRVSTGRVSLAYGQRLREFAVLADVAEQRTSLAVSGWDVRAKEGIDIVVDEVEIQEELEGGLAGGAVLKQAFGERPERLVHLAPANDEEAKAWAKAYYRRLARRFVTGSGVCEGDGRLRVGSQLSLDGLGPLFNGEYDVVEVQHHFDESQGYRTHFRVERPWLGR